MKTIDNAKLKLIAMLTMFIDHIGAALIERSSLILLEEWQTIDVFLRMVGRIAFPLYCFMLVEAFLHTRNRKKYMLSLLIMGMITEPVFDFAFFGSWNTGYQNVLFTLVIGFLVIVGISQLEKRIRRKVIRLFAIVFVVILGCLIAEICKTDYSYSGIMLIAILYLLRYETELKCIIGSLMFFANPTAIVAFLLIYMYNGEKGTLKIPHWLYRYFYPLHLAVLAGIQMIMSAGA